MFKIIKKKDHRYMVETIVGMRRELTELYMTKWELEDIALDAQFLLEENRITKYPEIAEDVIDRVDDMNLRLKGAAPDEDDEA
jgi:hypothetical protein